MTNLSKHSRQNSEDFLLEFRKWRKIDKLSKKTYLQKCSSELVQRNYDKPALTMLAKDTDDLFRSKSEKDSNATFSKRKLSLFLPSKSEKKSSSGHAECSCDNLVKNFSSNSWKFLLEIRKRRKNDKLSKKTYSSNCSSEHAQWNFGKPTVTLLARIRKTIAKTKRDEYFFLNKNVLFLSKKIL